jgi:hypothetical protein
LSSGMRRTTNRPGTLLCLRSRREVRRRLDCRRRPAVRQRPPERLPQRDRAEAARAALDPAGREDRPRAADAREWRVPVCARARRVRRGPRRRRARRGPGAEPRACRATARRRHQRGGDRLGRPARHG